MIIIEEGGDGDRDFSLKSIRHGFIRRVYSILLMQQLLIVAFTSWFMFDKNTSNFVKTNQILLYVSFLTSIVLLLVVVCNGKIGRESPENVIVLCFFTLFYSYSMAAFTAYFCLKPIFYGWLILFGICFSIFLFSFQTTYDLTQCTGAFFIVTIGLFSMALIAIIWPAELLLILYGTPGAVLYSVYLMYDTQLMLNEKHTYRFSPDDQIFGAFSLYTDILMCFMCILKLIGLKRSEDLLAG